MYLCKLKKLKILKSHYCRLKYLMIIFVKVAEDLPIIHLMLVKELIEEIIDPKKQALD